MFIAELFIRGDSPWENFGKFYLSQEFIELTPEETSKIQSYDWYDTLSYLEKNVIFMTMEIIYSRKGMYTITLN